MTIFGHIGWIFKALLYSVSCYLSQTVNSLGPVGANSYLLSNGLYRQRPYQSRYGPAPKNFRENIGIIRFLKVRIDFAFATRMSKCWLAPETKFKMLSLSSTLIFPLLFFLLHINFINILQCSTFWFIPFTIEVKTKTN